MKYGDKLGNDRVSICNLFANFFSSVHKATSDESVESEMNAFYESLEGTVGDELVFSMSDVQDVLKRFDSNKVSSPDGIAIMFYKKLSESLALPLSILFNKSIKERVFSNRWKLGFISPIFKDVDTR